MAQILEILTRMFFTGYRKLFTVGHEDMWVTGKIRPSYTVGDPDLMVDG